MSVHRSSAPHPGSPAAANHSPATRPDTAAPDAAASEGDGPVAVAHGNTLFGRGLLYVVIWSLQLVAGTVVSPILAHVMGPVEFGALASAIALHQVLSVLALLGIDQALVLQRAEDGNSLSARGLVAVGMAVGLVVALGAGLTAPLWRDALGFGNYSGLVVAVTLWTAPAAAVQVMLALLLAEDRLRPFAWVSGLAAVGGQVFGLVLLFTIHNDATTYAWGGVISQVVAMGIGIAVTRPSIRGLVDWPVAWRAAKLGIPLAMGGLAYFVLNAGDRVVIQRILGPEEVGRYQIAYVVGSVVLMLLTFTSSAWTPQFAALRDTAARWALAAHSRDELYRLLLPVTLGVTCAAPIVLKIAAPGSFHTETLTPVVLIIALSAFPVAASGATGRLLIVLRRGKIVALIAGVGAAVNLGLNLLAVPLLGIVGAALSTLVAFGVLALLQRLALPREPAWRPPPTWLVWAVVGVVAVSVASTALPPTQFWDLARFGAGVACLPWFFISLRRARRGTSAPPPKI